MCTACPSWCAPPTCKDAGARPPISTPPGSANARSASPRRVGRCVRACTRRSDRGGAPHCSPPVSIRRASTNRGWCGWRGSSLRAGSRSSRQTSPSCRASSFRPRSLTPSRTRRSGSPKTPRSRRTITWPCSGSVSAAGCRWSRPAGPRCAITCPTCSRSVAMTICRVSCVISAPAANRCRRTNSG